MINHISLPIADFERSRAFYDRVLATLGSQRIMDVDEGGVVACGYGGPDHEQSFWIGTGDGEPAPQPMAGHHIAFTAPDRAAVDRFHAAALAAGGRDNGAPGLRTIYHPNYYAAFVYDPDGHHIEAVCHRPE